MKTIAFFNNRGGVGRTSLVYHLAWAYADLDVRVVAVDLDPQANLTSMFIDDEQLEGLWGDKNKTPTIYDAISPLLVEGVGDVSPPGTFKAADGLSLVAGHLALSSTEDELSSQWSDCLDGKPRAFRVMSAFWRAIEFAAEEARADLVLIDVGPNLGAINRAALIAAQFIVIPLAPDLFSLQGLRNLGPTLSQWREQWRMRRGQASSPGVSLPSGDMTPLGYILMQHAVRLDRPLKAHDRWMKRVPGTYQETVLGEPPDENVSVDRDPHCLAALKHYRSLMPLAQEARKPMFHLRAADGALGAHAQAAQQCGRDFRALARTIAERARVSIPG